MSRNPFDFGTTTVAAAVDRHHARVRSAGRGWATTTRVALAVSLVLFGLSHCVFHGLLFLDAQAAAKEVAAEGEAAVKERSPVRYAQAETAAYPMHLLGCLALGAVCVLLGVGAWESPIACTAIAVACLVGILLLSARLPFIDYGPSGGLIYLASTVVGIPWAVGLATAAWCCRKAMKG